MADNNVPLLSAADRDEVLRMFREYGVKYNDLSAAIAAGKPAGDIKAALEKLDAGMVDMQSKYAALVTRAGDIEERLNYKPAVPEPAKSLGRLVIEDAGFIAAVKSPTGRFSYAMTVKADLFAAKDITGVSRTLPDVLPGVASGPRLPIGVRSLIPQGRTTQGAVTYVEETSFTNNAAPVAEGAAKPKSDKVFTPRTITAETIAHYFKVSKQTLADLPMVEAAIENNGIYGVQAAEDNELVNGTGVAPRLKGFLPIATAAPAPGTGGTLVDALGLAFFDLASKGYLPDGAVLNPANWGAMALLKNSQGNYLFANPIDYSAVPRIWGMRVVLTAKIASPNFLVGAFVGNSQFLVREDVNVQVATQNEDDFIKNMVTVLIEERVANLILNAAAFEKGVAPAGSLLGLPSEAEAEPKSKR